MSSRRLILSSCLFGFLFLLALVLIAPTWAQQQPASVAALQERANAGDAEALFLLGTLHEAGQAGGQADPARAAELYRRAADLGLPHAQFNLGNMYAAGHGVAADPFESILWLRRAADGGLAEAQFNLAVAYEQGHGVRTDLGTALRWYEKAAAQGYPKAQYNLAMMYEDGHGVAPSDSHAAELYLAAASQGYAPAQNNYGIMLAEGRGGLATNLVDAYAWLSLASEENGRTSGRDLVAQHLSNEQRAAASRRLAQLKSELSGEAAAELPSLAPRAATGVQVASINEPSLPASAEAAPAPLAATPKPAAVVARAAEPAAAPPIPAPSVVLRPDGKVAAPPAYVAQGGSPAERVAADRQAQQAEAPARRAAPAPKPASGGAARSTAAPAAALAADSTAPVPAALASTAQAASTPGRPAAPAVRGSSLRERGAVVAGKGTLPSPAVRLGPKAVPPAAAVNLAAAPEEEPKELSASNEGPVLAAVPEAQLKKLQAANAALWEENHELAQRLSNAPAPAGSGRPVSTLSQQRELERLRSDNAALRSDLESATRTLASLQREMRQARQSPSAGGGAAAAPDKAAIELQIASAVKSEAARYNHRIDELVAHEKRLVAENRELSQRLQEASLALQNAPASYEIERLQEDNASLTEELKRAKHAAALAREQVDSRVSSASSEAARLSRRVEELSASSARLTEQNRDLSDQLQSAKRALASTVPAADLRSLESEKALLRTELDRLKSERSQQESLVTRANEEKGQVGRQLAELRSANQRLSTELQEQRQKNQSAAMNLAASVPSTEFQQLKSQHEALSQQLSRASSEREQLQRELREARANAEKLVAENRGLNEQTQAHTRALADTVPVQRLQLLEAEKVRLTKELHRVEGERDQIQKRASTAMLTQADTQQKIEQLSSNNERLLAQVRDLEGQVQAAKTAIAGTVPSAELKRLESEKAALASDKNALASEKNALDAKLRHLASERSTLAKERDSLASERSALAARVGRIEAERDSLVSEKATLAAELNRLQSAESQSSQLAQQLADLRNSSERLVAQNRDLESQLRSAQQRAADSVPAADLQRAESQSAALAAERAALATELERLRQADAQLATANAQSSQLTQQVAELRNSSERLVAQNRDLESQLRSAQQRVAASVPAADLQRAESQSAALAAEKVALTGELERSKQSLALIQKDFAQLKAAAAKAPREMRRQIARAVEAETARVHGQLEELLVNSRQLAEQNRALTAQNGELGTQVETLRSNLAGTVPAERVSELEGQKALAEAELERARNEAVLQLRIADTQVRKTQSELAQVSAQVKELAAAREQLANDNRALSNQIQLVQLNLAASVPADELKRLEQEKGIVEANLRRAQLEQQQTQARLAEVSNAAGEHARQLDELRRASLRLTDENHQLNQRLHAQELALAAAVPPETLKKLESEKALLAASLERVKREHELYRQLSEARAAAAQAAAALATHRSESPAVESQRAKLIEDLRAQNAALKVQNARLSEMAQGLVNRRLSPEPRVPSTPVNRYGAAPAAAPAGPGQPSALGQSPGLSSSGEPPEELRLRVLELEHQLLQERINTARN